MITIELDGRTPSKKNSRQTVRATGRSFPSESYRRWHRAAMAQLMIQKVPRKATLSNGIEIRFYFNDLRRCDLTNKAESVMDLLVDYGILKDDSWLCTGPVWLIPELTEGKEGVFIVIHDIE